MKAEACQTLQQLIAQHGPQMSDDPRRCEALLRDYCGHLPREVYVLAQAARLGVPSELLARRGNGEPQALVQGRLVKRLQERLAMVEEAAHWAVSAWATALGVGVALQTPKPAPPPPPPQPPPPPVVVRPQPPAMPPGEYLVSPKGDGHFTTIRQALQSVSPGAKLHIRPGLYQESIWINQSVTLVGDGPLPDIVIESADGACLVVAGGPAVVRGLTFRLPKQPPRRRRYCVELRVPQVELTDCSISSDSVACLAIWGAQADPVVRRCKIHSGKTTGIYVYEGARGTIEDCDIFGHKSSGVHIGESASPTLRRCRIHRNRGCGVTVDSSGKGLIEQCEIFSNSCAGVLTRTQANPVIQQCQIHDNLDAGVESNSNGVGVFRNCEIFRNSKAGVSLTNGGRPFLENCRIFSNRLQAVRATCRSGGCVRNCDLRGNRLGAFSIQRKSGLEHYNNNY